MTAKQNTGGIEPRLFPRHMPRMLQLLLGTRYPKIVKHSACKLESMCMFATLAEPYSPVKMHIPVMQAS
jgi:hypothetical protein